MLVELVDMVVFSRWYVMDGQIGCFIWSRTYLVYQSVGHAAVRRRVHVDIAILEILTYYRLIPYIWLTPYTYIVHTAVI